MAESIVQMAWAYTNKRQSAYATPNPTGDIDQSVPFEGADFFDHAPNMSSNAELLGKGHEFANRSEIMSWDSRARKTMPASTKILGWAAAFHLGKVATTSLGGSPTAYRHGMEYFNPLLVPGAAGAGYYGLSRQQPVTTIMEQVGSALTRQFPSIVVSAIEITGANNDWVKFAFDVIGSGKMTRVTGYTFPDATETGLLREAGLTLTSLGVSGQTSDVASCDLRSWRFRSENSYFETDGYCPGSGYQGATAGTGQVRNRLEVARRSVLFEAQVRAGTDSTLFTRMENSTEMNVDLIVAGDIISGANTHSLRIKIPRMKIMSIPIGSDGDLVVYNLGAFVMWDPSPGLVNPFEIEIQNATASYLVSS